MNVETGELFKLTDEQAQEMQQKKLNEMLKVVPQEHEKEAKEILGEKDYAQADMSKNTPLVKWAKSEYQATKKVNRRKVRRKIADASRKRNRKRK